MKTLLQINTVVNTGPTGRIVEGIGGLILKQQWNSFIAYGRYHRPSSSQLIKIGNSLDNYLHGIKSMLLDQQGFGSKNATKKLIKAISDIEPDVIHLHNLHGYYIHIEALFNFLAVLKKPVVWTIHDCWPITGHCVYFDLVGCNKWEQQCFECPQTKTYPKSYFLDRSNINYQKKKYLFNQVPHLTIVSVSDWLQGILQKSYLSHYPIEVIHNGIDTEIFKPTINNLREKLGLKDKFVILGVANGWTQRKGLQDFIALSKKLESNYQIILIGLDNKQMNNLPPNIIGIGKLENSNDLVQYYSTADVFINASVEETFGLTIVEALACGTPAIVYDVTACPEIVTNETGIIVHKNNIDELLNAVKTIKSNKKIFYSQNCIERVDKYYNKDKQFLKYIDLYNRLTEA